jgi:serine O-acetyltransferase
MIIKYDLLRSYDLTPGKPLRRIFECYRSPGVQAVIAFRFSQWLRGQPLVVRFFLKPVCAFMNYLVRLKWGIVLAPESRIGKGLHIFHFGGIFVGEQVTIGENCSLSHDVTIGLSGEGIRRGAPTIGDNVYIAPGANISGKIRVGNNVKIGANAVVGKDVPDNALVQVPPMRVVTFPTFYGAKPESDDGE